ncbi:MAG TPA: OmpH family outer membrane protein [Opitutaceae bacterium]|jgi:outer membrane protein|nr:OmpH family outer membrane protein [Opitutaceae bacterium]
MKKTFAPLFALAASMVLALTVHAQPEPKILVVDIAKVFDNHYAKQTEETKLRGDAQKAEEDMQHLVKEGNDLVDQYKDLVDQSKNPALTPEARAKADDDSKKKMDEITTKQNELNSFKQTVQRQFQERIQTIHNGLVSSISIAAANVAKRHGATLLFDKSGISAFGANILLYSDPAYDITDEVIKEVNKDRPPSLPGSSSTAPAAPLGDEPKLTVPSLTPTNP